MPRYRREASAEQGEQQCCAGADTPPPRGLQEQPPVRFLVEHLRHMDVVRLSLFSDGQVLPRSPRNPKP